LKTRFPAQALPNRPARERLQTVLDVLDDLIAADWPRYRNLRPDWKSVRPRLASDPLLRKKGSQKDNMGWSGWRIFPSLTTPCYLFRQPKNNPNYGLTPLTQGAHPPFGVVRVAILLRMTV
jgi:hypothetical protein